VAMAVAAWLVWRRNGLMAFPMQIFLLQLFLNLAWSAVFFGFRAPGWAFLEIVALWCAILLTAITFIRTAPVAGCLMIPYLVWVSYAAALNFKIWRLNS